MVCVLFSARRRKGFSGRRKKKTLRSLRKSVMKEGWWSQDQEERKRKMITWSSAECVKTEGSCYAVTPALPLITYTASTPHCLKYPTESGSAPDVQWVVQNWTRKYWIGLNWYIWTVSEWVELLYDRSSAFWDGDHMCRHLSTFNFHSVHQSKVGCRRSYTGGGVTRHLLCLFLRLQMHHLMLHPHLPWKAGQRESSLLNWQDSPIGIAPGSLNFRCVCMCV